MTTVNGCVCGELCLLDQLCGRCVCLWRTLSPWPALWSLMCVCGELCLLDPLFGHWCVCVCGAHCLRDPLCGHWCVCVENSVSVTRSVVTDVCVWSTLSPWPALWSLMCVCGELCLRDPLCGHWCVCLWSTLSPWPALWSLMCVWSTLSPWPTLWSLWVYGCALSPLTNSVVNVCVCVYRGSATVRMTQRSVWV